MISKLLSARSTPPLNAPKAKFFIERLSFEIIPINKKQLNRVFYKELN